jgi:hypothetical protein
VRLTPEIEGQTHKISNISPTSGGNGVRSRNGLRTGLRTDSAPTSAPIFAPGSGTGLHTGPRTDLRTGFRTDLRTGFQAGGRAHGEAHHRNDLRSRPAQPPGHERDRQATGNRRRHVIARLGAEVLGLNADADADADDLPYVLAKAGVLKSQLLTVLESQLLTMYDSTYDGVAALPAQTRGHHPVAEVQHVKAVNTSYSLTVAEPHADATVFKTGKPVTDGAVKF